MSATGSASATRRTRPGFRASPPLERDARIHSPMLDLIDPVAQIQE